MSVWRSAEFDDHEQVCVFTDADTGLRAIAAVHSTARGPATGGTRFLAYASDEAALDDALRLSRAMSYKTALAEMPAGGCKGVIIGDPARLKTRALLHAYGRCIDRIGSSFATGEDVGMSVDDIETVREVTPYVSGLRSSGTGDSSIPTAIGLMHGLRAVAGRVFGQSRLEGLRIAIQGLGAVGWRIAEALNAEGARLIVADLKAERTAQAVEAFGAAAAAPEEIHAAEADIFCPCGLGGILTETSAREVRARAVAGAANNQLASPLAGEILADCGVLYAPDYVINAGGVISVVPDLMRMPGRNIAEPAPLEQRLAAIGPRLTAIFERSADEGRTPEAVAERMARALIGRG